VISGVKGLLALFRSAAEDFCALAIGSHTKPLEVRSRKLQVHFIAIAAYMVYLKNRLASRHGDRIAYQWHERWLRDGRLGSRLLAGFGRDSASVAPRRAALSNALNLLAVESYS
jgi:hypothetical protein